MEEDDVTLLGVKRRPFLEDDLDIIDTDYAERVAHAADDVTDSAGDDDDDVTDEDEAIRAVDLDKAGAACTPGTELGSSLKAVSKLFGPGRAPKKKTATRKSAGSGNSSRPKSVPSQKPARPPKPPKPKGGRNGRGTPLLGSKAVPGPFTTAQVTHLQSQIATYTAFTEGKVPPPTLLSSARGPTEESALPISVQLPPDMIEPWMTCVESISTLPNNNGSAIRMKIREATSLAETSERGPEISALLCLSIGSSVYRGNNGGGTKAVALHALEILKLKMVWRKHSGDTGGDVPPSALDAYFRPPRDESGVAPYDVRDDRGKGEIDPAGTASSCPISSRPGAYTDACEMAEIIRKTTPPGRCPSVRGGVPVDDIEGQKLFMTALEDFIHAEYNEVLDSVGYRIPTISGRKLNLTRLYREVCLRGGIGRVIRDKSWKSVASTFRFPPTLTGSSFTLRVHYQKFLEEYENRFFRKVGDVDGPVWTAANGNGKEDREKRGGEDLAQIAAMIPGGIHSGGMGVGVGGGRNGLRGMDIGTVGVNGGVGAISSYLVDDENDENGECGERFTQYEDLIILHARQQVGNRWPVISRLLPNRSAQVIKKYWHARLKYKIDSLDALESLVDKSREEDRSGGDGLYSMNETARLHVSAALAALGEGKYLIMQQYRQHQLQPELLGAFMQATILAQQASLPMDYAYDAHPSLFPSRGDLTNGAGPHHFSTMRPPLDGCSEVTFVQDLLYFLSAGASHAVDVDSMGVPLWPEVYLNEIRLDVFNLYRGVVERGGFDVVFPETDDLNADTPSPAQEEVFREMRNYKEGTIGVGGVLRAHYEYLLLKYESERYDDDVRLVVS